jgi:hypothetical protein
MGTLAVMAVPESERLDATRVAPPVFTFGIAPAVIEKAGEAPRLARVWSPVLDPDSVVIPSLVLIVAVVSSPVLVPERLDAPSAPVKVILSEVVSIVMAFVFVPLPSMNDPYIMPPELRV